MNWAKATGTVRAELSLTAKRPWRLLGVLSPTKWVSKYRSTRYGYDVPFVVEKDGEFSRRVYSTYEDYVAHQASKRDAVADLTLLNAMATALPPRIQEAALESARTVLCLGARSGAECQAFVQAGHFAIGIDLNPGKDNEWVVKGDFQNIQFADNSVDLVYSNSLDHAFEIASVASEIKRVLKPDGILWLEAGFGTDDAKPSRAMLSTDYESLEWKSVHDLFSQFKELGFETAREEQFDNPWPGMWTLLRAPRESMQENQKLTDASVHNT